jgi:hypothetical protein
MDARLKTTNMYQVDDSKEYSCKHKTLLAPNYLFFQFTDPKTREKGLKRIELKVFF